MSGRDANRVRLLVDRMSDYIPHADELGICFAGVDGEKLTMRLPWREELVGNPTTGAVHGGAITVLMDQTLGIAGLCSEQVPPTITPTLDLRIDHLRVATTQSDIMATAWVYRATRKILFLEGIAWCDSPDEPIAKATGSFVVMQELDLEKLWQLVESGE